MFDEDIGKASEIARQIAKEEIAVAKVELENKIKKLESDLKDIAKSLSDMLALAVKDLEAKIKRESPAIVPKSTRKKGGI